MNQLLHSIIVAWIITLVPLSAQQAQRPASQDLWKNPVVIGASVSDGYDRNEPIGGKKSEQLSLENFLQQLIVAKHGKIHNLGNKFFFMNPKTVSAKQVENAIELRPSVLLAPDFLFWLVYGNWPSEQARLSALESGLKLLESFDCPIVLGNIPDASKAIYKMLAPSQIPQRSTMHAANQKILAWARPRANVRILDNATFMQRSHQNLEIKLKSQTIPQGQTSSLLQTDFLHPTASGARAVSCAILECLQDYSGFPESDVDWLAN